METRTPAQNPQTCDLLLAQTRIIDAVADGTILLGSPEELTRRLAVSPTVFRAALHELVAAGWVFTTAGPGEAVLVGWERRSRDPVDLVPVERRGPSTAWLLTGASPA